MPQFQHGNKVQANYVQREQAKHKRYGDAGRKGGLQKAENMRKYAEIIEAAELKGKYKILGKIGNGGFGTVYKAIDLSTTNIVAIKRVQCANIKLKYQNHPCIESEILYKFQSYKYFPGDTNKFFYATLKALTSASFFNTKFLSLIIPKYNPTTNPTQ